MDLSSSLRQTIFAEAAAKLFDDAAGALASSAPERSGRRRGHSHQH
jgi:hypothetical protein